MHVKTNWNSVSFVKKKGLAMPKRHDVGAGYSTLSANLIRFSELNQLPIPIDLSRLDEGNGFEATFMEHGASGINVVKKVTKLRRAEKKQVSPEDKSDCSPPRKKICPSQATSCSIYLKGGPSHLNCKIGNFLPNLVLETRWHKMPNTIHCA